MVFDIKQLVHKRYIKIITFQRRIHMWIKNHKKIIITAMIIGVLVVIHIFLGNTLITFLMKLHG